MQSTRQNKYVDLFILPGNVYKCAWAPTPFWCYTARASERASTWHLLNCCRAKPLFTLPDYSFAFFLLISRCFSNVYVQLCFSCCPKALSDLRHPQLARNCPEFTPVLAFVVRDNFRTMNNSDETQRIRVAKHVYI